LGRVGGRAESLGLLQCRLEDDRTRGGPMGEQQLSKEQRILLVMRKVLTRVVRDVTPPAGMRSPLSDQTITDIRECLGLISARERELGDTDEDSKPARPRYVDEPGRPANVVSIDELVKKR